MGCVTTWGTCWQCTPVTTLTVDNNQIFIQSFEGFLKNHAKFCMAEITRVGHTSTSCQAGAKERFQQITEAYEALKACIRQSRVGCQLEPCDSIFCLTKESESNSAGNRWPIGFSLGTLPRASADDERPARVKGICDDYNFNPLFSKFSSNQILSHFLFCQTFPLLVSFSCHLCSSFFFFLLWKKVCGDNFTSPRLGSHPDLGLPRRRSGAARSHQSAIHAVLRTRNFRTPKKHIIIYCFMFIFIFCCVLLLCCC